MAQFARPDADDSVGGWGTSPLWSKVDEVTPNDSDLISASGFDGQSDTCKLRLSNVPDPNSSSGHIIRARGSVQEAGGCTTTIRVRLMQDGTPIRSWFPAFTGTTATFSVTLTGAQADSITNYNNLFFEFRGSYSGGIFENGVEITWCEFEVPDAPSEVSKTYTADAFLQKEKSKTLTADALLQKEKPRAYTADALLQEQKSEAYSADTILQAGKFATYLVDVNLRQGVFDVFLTDAVFSHWESAAWDTDDYKWDAPEGPSKDSVIWARFQDDSLALTDAVEAVKEILKAYAIDLLLQTINRQAAYALDALLQKGDIQRAYSIDALLQELNKAQAYTADALFQKEKSLSYTADALLQALGVGKDYLTDLLLKALAQQKSYSADAFLQVLDQSRSYSADTFLQSGRSLTYSLDSLLQARQFLGYAVDAILLSPGQIFYSIDVLLGHVFEAFLSDNVFSNWDTGEWDLETYWGGEGPGTDTSIQLFVLSDAMALTDAILPELVLVVERLLSDGMALSDALVEAFIQFTFLSDEVFTRWDSQTAQWDRQDEATRWAGEGPGRAASEFFRKFDDSQTISDAIDTEKIFGKALSDSISMSDSFEAFLGAPAPAGSIVRLRAVGTAQLVDLFPITIAPTGVTRYSEVKISGGGVIPQLSGKGLGGIAVEAVFIGTEAQKDQLMADIAALLGKPLKVEFLLHKEYREGAKARLVTFSSSLVKDGVYRIDLQLKRRR